jgi:hypothetical protein
MAEKLDGFRDSNTLNVVGKLEIPTGYLLLWDGSSTCNYELE